MFSRESSPWWERVNDYLQFDERDEFIRGALGFRPNNKQEIIVGMLTAGYVRNTFAKPEAHTGKNARDQRVL